MKMKFNKDGNRFTFGFAIVMVVIVATLLSVASISLKPFQNENIKREKMQNILKSVSVESSRKEAPEKFKEFVKRRLVLNYRAEVIADDEGPIDETNKNDAFNIDIKKEYRALPSEQRNYPLFICEKDGNKYYVIPMVGKGLWGPIWGYIALEKDLNTVYGASFDHKTETPGLGAEIKQDSFQKQFEGEKIFDDKGDFVSIKIIKGGAKKSDLHGVDAITGGTITCNGVSEMIERTLNTYMAYFKKKQNSEL